MARVLLPCLVVCLLPCFGCLSARVRVRYYLVLVVGVQGYLLLTTLVFVDLVVKGTYYLVLLIGYCFVLHEQGYYLVFGC